MHNTNRLIIHCISINVVIFGADSDTDQQLCIKLIVENMNNLFNSWNLLSDGSGNIYLMWGQLCLFLILWYLQFIQRDDTSCMKLCRKKAPGLPLHNDVIKWKHFSSCWPFVRWPVNSPHKGQWRGALMFSFICAWMKAWVNNHEAGDLGHHRAHYDVIVMNRYVKIFRLNQANCMSSDVILPVAPFTNMD